MPEKKRVTLLALTAGMGDNGFIETARFSLWAECEPPSERTQIAAIAAALKVEMVIYVWGSEFRKAGFTHVELKGLGLFRIASATASKKSPLKQRILLEKEVGIWDST